MRLVRRDAQGAMTFVDMRAQEIFDEVEVMSVAVDDDLTLGPIYLQEKVREVRGHLSRLETLTIEVMQATRAVERYYDELSSLYQMEYDELMTMDTEVARLSSAKDRESRVRYMLRDKRTVIDAVEAIVKDLGLMNTVLKSKKNDLTGINRDLKTLRQLAKDQVEMGTFYGQEGGPTQDAPEPANLSDLLSTGESQDDVDKRISDFEDTFAPSKPVDRSFNLNDL